MTLLETRRVSWALAILAALVLASSVLLTFATLFNFSTVFLTLLVVAFIAGLLTRVVSGYVRARRSLTMRMKLLGTASSLDELLSSPKLLHDNDSSRTSSSERLASELFFQAAEDARMPGSQFIHFGLEGKTYSNTEKPIVSAFVSEIVERTLRENTGRPLLMSTPSLFGSIELSKPALAVEVTEPLVTTQSYDRVIATHDFGRSFCLVYPFDMSSGVGEAEAHSAPMYVAFLTDSFISPSLASVFTTIADRFQALFRKTQTEQLALHLDDILNESRLLGLSQSADFVIEGLRVDLTTMLKRSFRASAVEIWIRGSRPDHNDPIGSLVMQLLKGGADVSLVDSSSSVLGNGHRLEDAVELRGCRLAYIRLHRATHPFTGFESRLLQFFKQHLDNYLRDQWVFVVTRRIDDEVLNAAAPTLIEFAQTLIRVIVRELDAMFGVIALRGSVQVSYVDQASIAIGTEEVLSRLARAARESSEPNVLRVSEGSLIVVPVAVGQEERLASIGVCLPRPATSVELELLKHVESTVDHIFKLYAVLHPHGNEGNSTTM